MKIVDWSKATSSKVVVRLTTTSLVSLLLVVSASAQTADPIAVQRAAAAIPILRSMMKDPDSFRLESVFLTKGRERKQRNEFEIGQYDICFQYRAHNSYGAYSGSEVALQIWSSKKSKQNGQILPFDQGEGLGTCAAKNIAMDITTEVNAALTPSTPPVDPANKAKQAQQYADCLKMAIDNPAIVCKAPQATNGK
ncbi:MAG: hypothetical protein ACLQJF_08500 [Candidatus Sulfotelmatobacter sp.]